MKVTKIKAEKLVERSDTMKILHTIPYLNPEFGGDVKVCSQLTNQLVKNGHDVTILTTDYKLDQRYVHDLSAKVEAVKCYKEISSIYYSPDIRDWLTERMSTFDIVHSHEYRTYQNYVLNDVATQNDVPIIVQPHGSTARAIAKQKRKWIFDALIGKSILQKAEGVIAVSEYEAQIDRKYGADPVEIIYNGIDTDRYKAFSSSNQFKAEYDISGPIILYVGRIHESKGIDTLVKAFAKVDCEEATLVIVGPDNGFKQVIEDLAEELGVSNRTILTGFVSEEMKLAAYRDATVFVNPARYMGGVALTVIEALLCGTPVIATPQSAEIIKKSNSGYIVENGDIDQFRNLIGKIIRDPCLMSNRVDQGQQYILENLRWLKVADSVEKFYEEIIETQ